MAGITPPESAIEPFQLGRSSGAICCVASQSPTDSLSSSASFGDFHGAPDGTSRDILPSFAPMASSVPKVPFRSISTRPSPPSTTVLPV